MNFTMAEQVLFVGYEGAGLRHLVAPAVRQKLEAGGIRVIERYFSDLNAELLGKFDTVVVVFEGVQENINTQEDAALTLNGHIAELRDFVECGGGLFLFFTQGRYTEDFEPDLNLLLRPWGARVWLERFIESNEDNIHRFQLQDPNCYYSFRSTNLNGDHPITTGSKSFWLSHMVNGLAVDEHWTVLVRGDRSVRGAGSAEPAPPFMAVRDAGRGRVLVFSAHSSHYFNDGDHLFYDNGQLLNNGDTWRVLENALRYLGANSPRDPAQTETFAPIETKGGYQIRRSEKLDHQQPFRGVFGLRSNHSGGGCPVAEYARKARELKLDFLVFADAVDDADSWRQLVNECDAATGRNLVVMPGVAWRDPGGNRGYAGNIAVWPPQTRHPEFIFTMLETPSADCRGIYVFGDPHHNAGRPWELGGFNALAAVTKVGGEEREFAFDYFEKLQSQAGMSLLPVVMDEIWTPAQLERSATNGFSSYLLAPSLAELRRTFANDLMPGFISSGGIELEHFSCRKLMFDPWENYILWEPAEQLELRISLAAPVKLTQVELYSGSRCIRRFHPAETAFAATIPVVMASDGPFWLKAVAENGGRLYSYALPTRNLNYWNHVGSDRMNDYHNPVQPDPAGEILYDGRRYSFGGLVTLAYGWGNYLRFYHPAPSYRYHPQGYETGQIVAGLETLSTYPHLKARQLPEGAVEPDRCQKLATRDVAVVDESFPRMRTVDSEYGREYRDLRLIDAKTRLVIFRYDYEPFGYIIIRGSTTLTALADLNVKDLPEGELALTLLKLCYKGVGKDFTRIRVRGADGAVRSFPATGEVSMSLGRGSFATFTPDPYGLLGVHLLSGSRVTARLKAQQAPAITVGIELPGGSRIPRGRSWKLEWIVTQAGGGDQVELFDDLTGLWGLDEENGVPAYAPDRLERGTLLKEPYWVALAAADCGAVATFPDPEKLPNRLLPVRVDGLPDNVSCGALNLETGDWYPGGVLDGSMYLGLEKAGRYFLGAPLSAADNEDLIIEVTGCESGRIRALLHNPTAKRIDGAIQNNLDGSRQPVSLAPGEICELRAAGSSLR